MKYVYPALFTPCEKGMFAVRFPDLPGTNTQGNNLYEAIYMAEIALAEWLEYLSDKRMEIPKPSSIKDVAVESGQFVNLVRAEVLKVAV